MPFRSSIALVLLPIALSAVSCAQEETASVSDCAETQRFLNEECLVDGVFRASEVCDPDLLAEELSATCSENEKADIADGLCAVGITAHCPMEACEEDQYPEFSAQCTDYIGIESCGACDYYQCREETATPGQQCDSEGYYIPYGHKYCERFQKVTKNYVTPETVAWIDRTMVCLMNAIEDEVTPIDSCGVIKKKAFDSHPRCYLDAGFCDLPLSDMSKVFFTVDLEDFQLRQVLLTGVGCLKEWASGKERPQG